MSGLESLLIMCCLFKALTAVKNQKAWRKSVSDADLISDDESSSSDSEDDCVITDVEPSPNAEPTKQNEPELSLVDRIRQLSGTDPHETLGLATKKQSTSSTSSHSSTCSISSISSKEGVNLLVFFNIGSSGTQIYFSERCSATLGVKFS